jgi:hypothetical protein
LISSFPDEGYEGFKIGFQGFNFSGVDLREKMREWKMPRELKKNRFFFTFPENYGSLWNLSGLSREVDPPSFFEDFPGEGGTLGKRCG